MKRFCRLCVVPILLILAGGVWLLVPSSGVPQAQEPKSKVPKQPSAEEIAAMMAKAKKFTQPGKHHELLERFLGKWDTETRLTLGGRKGKPEKGTSETTWLMKGRWLKTEAKGTMLGQPVESFAIMGYDNFKMSYVFTQVTSMDTGLFRAEGDLDPGGKALLLYGTLDEYLTGEHDKMVKSVTRFLADDKIVLEIHDLPIGEKNTQVLEITYTRQK